MSFVLTAMIGCHCLESEQIRFLQASHGRIPEVRQHYRLPRGERGFEWGQVMARVTLGSAKLICE